jgi:hypothetical protein
MSRPNHSSRNTDGDREIGDITGDNTASSDDRALANRYSIQDCDGIADPAVILNGYAFARRRLRNDWLLSLKQVLLRDKAHTCSDLTVLSNGQSAGSA